jgi:hypothetical protein
VWWFGEIEVARDGWNWETLKTSDGDASAAHHERNAVSEAAESSSELHRFLRQPSMVLSDPRLTRWGELIQLCYGPVHSPSLAFIVSCRSWIAC